uniref:Uncharacterized protein n=1 Tax=Cacopsylla melanoneura TaxID=428564 RepID=A0A8D9BVG8_9HEMI
MKRLHFWTLILIILTGLTWTKLTLFGQSRPKLEPILFGQLSKGPLETRLEKKLPRELLCTFEEDATCNWPNISLYKYVHSSRKSLRRYFPPRSCFNFHFFFQIN